MLAHFAKDIELLWLSTVRMVIYMLKFNSGPSLEALTVHISVRADATARCHMLVLIIALVYVAKSAINLY